MPKFGGKPVQFFPVFGGANVITGSFPIQRQVRNAGKFAK